MSKLSICLIIKFPNRPAITEIYGKVLPHRGNNITWITPTRETYNLQEEHLKKINVINIDFPRPKIYLMVFRVFIFLSYYYNVYKTINQIFKTRKYDIVQVRNNVFDGFMALYVKKKYKIPFVFQYSFPHSSYKLISDRFQYKASKKIEGILLNFILKKADLVFPISNWMMDELVNEGISKSKMIPLPMGANINFFNINKDGKKIRAKYGINHCKIVLYLGIMDKERNLETIIRSFSHIASTDNIKLMMVGHGNDKKNLEKLSNELNLNEKIIFTGYIPYFEIPHYIAASDICLSPIPPIPIYKISSPTKLFEYMAMGKPVIANNGILEHEKVIEESKCGILVNYDEISFANAILKLYNKPEIGRKMGRNGYEWVLKHRTYEKISIALEKTYDKLIQKNKL